MAVLNRVMHSHRIARTSRPQPYGIASSSRFTANVNVPEPAQFQTRTCACLIECRSCRSGANPSYRHYTSHNNHDDTDQYPERIGARVEVCADCQTGGGRVASSGRFERGHLLFAAANLDVRLLVLNCPRLAANAMRIPGVSAWREQCSAVSTGDRQGPNLPVIGVCPPVRRQTGLRTTAAGASHKEA